MGLTKPEFDKNFAFLTLITEEAQDIILMKWLTFNHEKLQVSITHDRSTGNPSELQINMILVANNLPQREPQTFITQAIKQTFGADNILGVSNDTNNHPYTDKQVGWYHIQCISTAVYTEWLHKSTYIYAR